MVGHEGVKKRVDGKQSSLWLILCARPTKEKVSQRFERVLFLEVIAHKGEGGRGYDVVNGEACAVEQDSGQAEAEDKRFRGGLTQGKDAD